MQRNEMLDILCHARFNAYATVFTMDMGLEFEYYSPKGFGTELGRFGSWPAWKLRPISAEQWEKIAEKLRHKTIDFDDLDGTDLILFARSVLGTNAYGTNLREAKYPGKTNSEILYNLFNRLYDINPTLDHFFCLFDSASWDGIPSFHQSYDDIAEAFDHSYCGDYTPWDELADEELEEWVGQVTDSDGLNFNSFEELDEDPDDDTDSPAEDGQEG